jgi:outer membrane protein assembly factor BamB
MKPLLSVLALMLTATAVTAQDPRLLFSRPAVPPREALDRLNLQLGWRTYIPVESGRDGIYSVQFTGREMFVQTRSGMVVSLDPETGETHWRSLPGLPYRDKHPVGYNSALVFVVDATTLYALSRATGAVVWQFDLPDAVIAAPAADEEQVYLSFGGGVTTVYAITRGMPPKPARKNDMLAAPPAGGAGGPETMPAPGGGTPPPPPPTNDPLAPKVGDREAAAATGPYSMQKFRPYPRWTPPPLLSLFEHHLDAGQERPPLLTNEFMMLTDRRGTLLGLSKYQRAEAFRFPTGGQITAPSAQYGDIAYAPSQDQNVYALNIATGRSPWHYTLPTEVYWPPQVTDQDVYLSPAGAGLYRLLRETGQLVWHSGPAQRFLAANPKFVYATDRSGRLLVLDQWRGTYLSGYDTHDYVVPISNEYTDRFYLAANDGLLICLHDREYVTPVQMRRPTEKLMIPLKGLQEAGTAPVEKPKEGPAKPPDNPAMEKPR